MGKQPTHQEIKLIKSAYIRYRMWRYALEHPGSTEVQQRYFAGKMWNRKVKRWQEHGFIEMEVPK